MKKILVILILILLGIVGIYYWKNPLTTKAIINGHTILVDVAVTESEKEKGLGFRDTLPPDHGMLFVYDHKEQFPFWMKGMRFPLDFIWIDGTSVVDVTTNVPPPALDQDQLPIYHPKVSVDKILEVNAGAVERYGIKIGDAVKFKN